MPHIRIQMYPGRSDDLKQALAEKTRDFFAAEMNADKKYFSVAIEDVAPENWKTDVEERIPEGTLYVDSNF